MMAQQPTTVFVSQEPSTDSKIHPILASGSRIPEPRQNGEARDARISISTTGIRGGRAGSSRALNIWVEEDKTPSGVHRLPMRTSTMRRRLPEPPLVTNTIPASAPPQLENTQSSGVIRPLPPVPQTSSISSYRSVPTHPRFPSMFVNSSTLGLPTTPQLERAKTFSGTRSATNKVKPRRPLPAPTSIKVDPQTVNRSINSLPPLPSLSRTLPPLPPILPRVDEDTEEQSQIGEDMEDKEDKSNLIFERIPNIPSPKNRNMQGFGDDEDASPAAAHRRLVIPKFPSISRSKSDYGSKSKEKENQEARNVLGTGQLAIEVLVEGNFKLKEAGHTGPEEDADYTWLPSDERLQESDIPPAGVHSSSGYTCKWVREKKGRRVTERDFEDIVRTLRDL